MKFEKLSNKNNSKKVFLYGFITCAILLIMFNFLMSYAKYKVVDSVKLASGTVNYSRADFSLIGIKVQEKNEDGSGKTIEGGLGKDYKDADKIPEDGDYEFNEENTYCTIGDNVHITGREALLKAGITITYENSTGLIFSGIKQTNTKCYVYFDVHKKEGSEKTLASLNLHKNGDIGAITGPSCGSCKMTENGLYQTEDNDGVSYIFRGSVSNNWVKFANLYWRIIRINGDGSIRLIYAGESSSSLGPKSNGTNIATGTSNNYVKYNDSYGDNTYVGFTNKGSNSNSYDDAHGGTTPSNILNQLNTWFKDKKLDQSPNIDHIEKSAGFCNDRGKPNANTHGSSYTQEGFGTKPTVYGPGHRVMQSNNTSYVAVGQEQKPTLKCGMDYSNGEGTVNDTYLKRDLYTVQNDKNIGNEKLTNPVGLITMDEVILAGGFAGQANDGYWLNTGEHYWTMSPNYWNDGYAYVFYVYSDGTLRNNGVIGSYGVRPVINLKANLTFKGNGNIGTPFEISE